jgi:hypothetical protein
VDLDENQGAGPMRVVVTKENIALLELVKLQNGGHTDCEDGMCAMEALAFIAGIPHTDRPACCAESVTMACQRLNDSADSDEERQKLKPLLPRVLNTAPITKAEQALERRRQRHIDKHRHGSWQDQFRAVETALDMK